MLPRPRGRGSAALGHGRLGLGQVDLGGERLATGLGHHGGGLGRGEVTLAGLLGRVGGHGQAFEALDRARVRLGGVLPRAGRVGVLAERGIGIGGENRGLVGGGLDQRAVFLPGLPGVGQLLLARVCVGVGGLVEPDAGGVLVASGLQGQPAGRVAGVLASLLEGGLFLRVQRRALAVGPAAPAAEGIEQAAVAAAGADAEQDQAAADEEGKAEVHRLDGATTAAAAQIEEHEVSYSTTYSESPKSGGPTVINSAAARLASRRSANLSNTMLARKRTTIGAVSNPVVTGSAPGIAAAMMAMMTVA